ncbi:MAG TPA: hypothetical protein VIW24_05545 [Aldersonia sp.]
MGDISMSLRDSEINELSHVRCTGVAPQLATRHPLRRHAADAAHGGEYRTTVALRGHDIGRVPMAEAVEQLDPVPENRSVDASEFVG